ncbi:hypothetical protein JKP88DRAFT_349671 [Tribonema minus]|uniref:Cap-specific mRNA (nucleoside-2'-O-)-methyltransferase 1 n=1 Tax=Tribonema minus TaxID=303371 RepID=A0A835YU31_9STRA|nr:hypothetical protein JKP88DRAFT_349671 [Tribonema minus]
MSGTEAPPPEESHTAVGDKRSHAAAGLPSVEESDTTGWAAFQKCKDDWFDPKANASDAAAAQEEREVLTNVLDSLEGIAAGAYEAETYPTFPDLWLPCRPGGIMSKLPSVAVDAHGVAWLVNERHTEESAAELLLTLLPAVAEKVEVAAGSLALVNETMQDLLLSVKAGFDPIPPRVFMFIRSACNPAEGIGRASFINRSAMKLANLDYLMQLVVTPPPAPLPPPSPAAPSTPPVHCTLCGMRSATGGAHPPPSRWLDVCAGPGGFTEYICWKLDRRRRQAGSAAAVSAGATDATAASLAYAQEGSGGGGGGGASSTRAGGYGAEAGQGQALVASQSAGAVAAAREDAAMAAARSAPLGFGWGMTLSAHADASVAQERSDWQLQHLRALNAAVCHGGDHEGPARTMPPRPALPPPPPRAAAAAAQAAAAEATHAVVAAGQAEVSGAPEAVQEAAEAAECAIAAAATAMAAAAPAVEDVATHFRTTYARDGTGDVTREANLAYFAQLVDEESGGGGVDLAMADGGTAAARHAPSQEHALSLLVVCEARAALAALRRGGSFVIKLFGTEGALTAGLVLALSAAFMRVAVVKPLTSRPASAERFLVCRGLLLGRDALVPLLRRLETVAEQLRERHGAAVAAAAAAADAGATIPAGREPELCIVRASMLTATGGGGSGDGTSGTHAAASSGGGGSSGSGGTSEVAMLPYLRRVNDALMRLQLAACSAIAAEAADGNLHFPEGPGKWQRRRTREQRLLSACERTWGIV